MMKKRTNAAVWIIAGFAALFLYAGFVHWFQWWYAPPDHTADVTDVLAWTGRPRWVTKYSSPTATYYEIGMDVPVWTLALTSASGEPSYTVDSGGNFIGWSPDSGDVLTPNVLQSHNLTREGVDVHKFMSLAKEMEANITLPDTQ